MEFVIQIVITGLTMGSMYALAAVGLSLIYGTLGMFNMAHGLFMTFGGYMAYSAATAFSSFTPRDPVARWRTSRSAIPSATSPCSNTSCLSREAGCRCMGSKGCPCRVGPGDTLPLEKGNGRPVDLPTTSP